MSLKLRHHLYHSFCVTARFHLSPAPTSVNEVQFIHNAFKTVSPVEFFLVEQFASGASNPFRHHLTVVLNALDRPQDAIHEIGPGEHSAAVLRTRQLEISRFLSTICGLPRFSYVENEDRYFAGRLYVPFKHSLASDGRYLKGQYDVSESTVDSPFFTLSSDHDLKLVGSKLRHNFQKYHKLKPAKICCNLLRYYNGWDGLYKEKLNLNISPGTILDPARLADLSSVLDTPEPATKENEFRGFLT